SRAQTWQQNTGQQHPARHQFSFNMVMIRPSRRIPPLSCRAASISPLVLHGHTDCRSYILGTRLYMTLAASPINHTARLHSLAPFPPSSPRNPPLIWSARVTRASNRTYKLGYSAAEPT